MNKKDTNVNNKYFNSYVKNAAETKKFLERLIKMWEQVEEEK